MEQYIMNSDGLRAILSNIVFEIDGAVFVHEGCSDMLQEIFTKLTIEDTDRSVLLAQLTTTKFVRKILIPLMLNCEDSGVDLDTVFPQVIKLLCHLLQPLEFLVPILSKKEQECSEQDHCQLVISGKKSFIENPSALGIILAQMNSILGDGKEPLSIDNCEIINHCLFLFRSLLFLNDTDLAPSEKQGMHQQLLLTMFEYGIKRVLMVILKSSQLYLWCVPMAQLICLMYCGEVMKDKDDHTVHDNSVSSEQNLEETIQNFICQNGTCSDSSSTVVNFEDRESLVTMTTESGSSQKLGDSVGDAKDSGVEMDWADKPFTTKDMKAPLDLLNGCIHEELQNIKLRECLRDFSDEFLKNHAFAKLIEVIRSNQMLHIGDQLPDLYPLWMLCNFIEEAITKKVPLSAIHECLTIDVTSFAVCIAIDSWENILVSKNDPHGRDFNLQRIMLAIKVLRKQFQLLDYAKSESQLTPEYEEHVISMGRAMAKSPDLRNLFLLLVRQFEPSVMGTDLLADIIMANHSFLVVVEEVKGWGEEPFNLVEHIKQFATQKIMKNYGLILEDFQSNSEYLNECIFTMMYHVAGDCSSPNCLLQLPILKVFADIWDSNIHLPVESHDLVNYVLQHFISVAGKEPGACIDLLFNEFIKPKKDEKSNLLESFWSAEELDLLFEIMIEEDGVNDATLTKVQQVLHEKGFTRTREQVALQLYKLCHLGNEADDRLCEPKLQQLSSEELVKSICETINQEWVTWLQNELLELCFIKLGGRYLNKNWIVEGMVMYNYNLKKKSIPLVPFTEVQEQALESPQFRELLHPLGFDLPQPSHEQYPRMHQDWTPQQIVNKARMLGEVDFVSLKFREEDLIAEEAPTILEKTPPPAMRSCKMSNSWGQVVWRKRKNGNAMETN